MPLRIHPEELGFGLWYLAEKHFAKIGDDTKYRVTAEGVDFVENKLDDDLSELRNIAVAQIPAANASQGSIIHL